MARTLFDVDDPPDPTPVASPARPRRAAIIPVRLTESERDQLTEVARDLGLSVSTYMRQVVLSRPLPPRRAVRPIPEINRETYHALELVTRFLGTVRAEVLGTTLTPEGGDS